MSSSWGCGPCAKRRAQQAGSDRRSVPADRRQEVDPTRALFAAARPTYEVAPHSGAARGKRFSTLSAAQEYARKTHGVIRTV